MASSLLTTDKRWAAPSRKSGMTVLGKIPKPINLPSQRLENHGLDPNVELVPKGTFTWNKTAAATPNAWSSSSLISPKNDGGSGSPSHINGRPSSGGGSRPSTAGSESLDSPNAWGPNSRPSTASGTLPSHHLPMATTRPRSAETRPGSSQLSRFADNSSENMKVSIRTIERTGSSSHGHGFTLSTGDFPSLGSEKSSESNSQRGHSSKGRPTSSSGKEAAENEQGKSPTAGSGERMLSASNQPVDIMKTEHYSYDGGAPFPATSLPNDQQPHPYPPNFCMPPPQFDSWRPPPGHPPEGMWHRGPAPGGPYRPVVPPGSFPVEPFPYYGQFPHNSEAAARHGSAHGGYHPKNGDGYHSMPPNSFIMNQPVLPVRPVYQGPMPYDGYYGPPRANFNTSNVRDSPFVGGSHQPGILNQFPNQNDRFQPGYSHNRPQEQLESDRVRVIRRGQPGILNDSPDHLGGPCEVERKAQPTPPLLPHPDGNRTDMNMRADMKDTFSEKNRVLMKPVHDQRGPAGISRPSISENTHSYPTASDDGTLQKKFKEDNTVTLDLQPVIKKNVALIEKIESLNNKARNVDARNIAEPVSFKEHKEKQQKGTNAKVDQKFPNAPIDDVVVEPSCSQLTEASKARKLSESTHDRMHRRGDSSRNSHHGPAKDKLANSFERNGWGENSTVECSPVIDLSDTQHDQPQNASQLPPVTVTDDIPASLDYESQRAKMRELAVQRAKQLQAEEEERTKQQKAKALAKLEELNRRALVHLNNSNDAPPEIDSVCNKQKAGHDVITKPTSLTAESSEPPTNPKHSALVIQSKSVTLPDAASASKDPADQNISSSARNTQSNMMGHAIQKNIPQSREISVSKSKQGYRKRQVVSEEKVAGEKSSVTLSTDNTRKVVGASLDTPASIVTMHDDPPPQNKKGTRHSRNKKKVDDTPATSKHPPVLPEQNTVKVSNEPKTQTAGVIISSSIVPTEGTIVTVGSITVGGISFGSLNQECPKPPQEAHNTSNSHPRAQQAKKYGKSQHAVRPVEKPHGNEGVVWAPVKLTGYNDQSDEATLKAVVTAPTQSAGKSTSDGENVTRTKRAEMERYVPKPLSKELQQQLGQPLPSEKSYVDNKSHDKEAVEKSTAAKAEATTDPKKWEDKKTSRGHGKSHASWRRRNTDEAALVVPNPGYRVDYSQESDETKKPSDQHQPLEPDRQEDAAAGNSSAPTVPLPVVAAKEHSAGNKQRRQHIRAQRNERSNYSNENKDREGRKDVSHEMPALAMESNSFEHGNMPRSDVKSSGTVTHSRAHWKPKSNPYSQNNSQGNDGMDGQVDNSTLQENTDSNLAQYIGGNKEKNANIEQGKGELLPGDDSQKSESHENAEHQQLNTVPRRQGHYNGRYHRGGGAQRGRGYDAGKPGQGTNAERRKGGPHLEYQPVGSYNKPVDLQQNPSSDELTEGPPAPGAAYRERSHNRGLRPAGHFVKRNPASARAANSYQDE